MASAISFTRIIFPLLSMDALAISVLGSSAICRSSSAVTACAKASLSVTRTAEAILSCSACESKSAAMISASELPSAITRISLGPAIISIETCPNTCFFASATKALPGPTILSTRGMLSVPYASAATACAPPILKIRSTPAISAAAMISGFNFPSFAGVTMQTSLTPAIFAGIQSISTVEG